MSPNIQRKPDKSFILYLFEKFFIEKALVGIRVQDTDTFPITVGFLDESQFVNKTETLDTVIWNNVNTKFKTQNWMGVLL